MVVDKHVAPQRIGELHERAQEHGKSSNHGQIGGILFAEAALSVSTGTEIDSDYDAQVTLCVAACDDWDALWTSFTHLFATCANNSPDVGSGRTTHKGLVSDLNSSSNGAHFEDSMFKLRKLLISVNESLQKASEHLFLMKECLRRGHTTIKDFSYGTRSAQSSGTLPAPDTLKTAMERVTSRYIATGHIDNICRQLSFETTSTEWLRYALLLRGLMQI